MPRVPFTQRRLRAVVLVAAVDHDVQVAVAVEVAERAMPRRLNMVGDAVRDLLDPRLRGGSGRLGAYGAQAVSKATLSARPARK